MEVEEVPLEDWVISHSPVSDRIANPNPDNPNPDTLPSIASMPLPDDLHPALSRLVAPSTTSGTSHDRLRFDFLVQWLQSFYEMDAAKSTSRNAIYSHYVQFCEAYRLAPLSVASFGRAIKSVFPHAKVRRLGTRGQSKYHFCGVGQKESIVSTLAPPINNNTTTNHPALIDHLADSLPYKSALRSFVLPHVASLPLPDLTAHLNPRAREFGTLYTAHCVEFHQELIRLQLMTLENVMRLFWQRLVDSSPTTTTTPDGMLEWLATQEAIAFVMGCDSLIYDRVTEQLTVDVLKRVAMEEILQVRQLAKRIETLIESTMTGMPDPLIQARLRLARVFSQTLRRYTTLNHLANQLYPILDDDEQLEQMQSDFAKLDLEAIHDQASWICECRPDVIANIEHGFRQWMTQNPTPSTLASWLNSLTHSLIPSSSPFTGSASVSPTSPRSPLHHAPSPTHHPPQPPFSAMTPMPVQIRITAQQFLLRWTYLTGLILRDLSLRSAPSFGAFHILRLFADEFLFWVLERKVVGGEDNDIVS